MPMGCHYAREHVHTRFYILRTAELIVLKFPTWAETDMICGFDKATGVSVHMRNCKLHLFLGSWLE